METTPPGSSGAPLGVVEAGQALLGFELEGFFAEDESLIELGLQRVPGRG